MIRRILYYILYNNIIIFFYIYIIKEDDDRRPSSIIREKNKPTQNNEVCVRLTRDRLYSHPHIPYSKTIPTTNTKKSRKMIES